MIIINDSFLLTTATSANSTIEINDTSSSGIILTIIILSFLSVSGWIFMSYALFGRSEAYRSKPDDQNTNFSDRTNGNDFFADFE
jgi:hypothetical protein